VDIAKVIQFKTEAEANAFVDGFDESRDFNLRNPSESPFRAKFQARDGVPSVIIYSAG
jgi:hypothetical protein